MDTQQRNIKEKWVTFYILKFATHVKTSKRKKKKNQNIQSLQIIKRKKCDYKQRDVQERYFQKNNP